MQHVLPIEFKRNPGGHSKQAASKAARHVGTALWEYPTDRFLNRVFSAADQKELELCHKPVDTNTIVSGRVG